MHDEESTLERLTRRRMLWGTAAGMAVTWSGTALAAPGMTKTRSTKARPTTKSKAKPKAKPKATSKTKAGPSATATKTAPGLAPVGLTLTPQGKALGDAIADRIKHAITTAASRPLQMRFQRSGYADVTQRYVKSLSKAKRNASKSRATRLLAAPAAERKMRLGSAATMSPALHRKRLRPLPAKVGVDAVRSLSWKFKAAAHNPHGISTIPNPYKKIGFFLNEVKCLEETDEVGADEIVMGALLVSPTGEVEKTKAITISNDFDEGEKKTYYKAGSSNFVGNDPMKGRHLVSAPLVGPEFPAPYTLLLVLWERDDGGFADTLRDLYVEVAKEAKLAMMGASASFAGPIGPYLGLIASYVLEAVVAFLAWMFDNPDDRIDEHQATVTLASYNDTYFDEFASSRENATPSNVWAAKRYTVNMRGDGGRYRIKLHWRVWR